MAPGPAQGHRAAADLGARRHHELLHLRPEPAAPCLRRGCGEGRPPHPPGAGRRGAARARRARLYAPPRHDGDFRRCQARRASPASWAASIRAARKATVNVFLESAYWDPVTIATTGRALKINSDARYRFERGVDPAFTLPGLEAATRMILDLCGGEASEVVADGAPLVSDRAYRLDTDHVQALVGMAIPAEVQRRTLEALGFRMEGDMAHPPSWRPTCWARRTSSRRSRASRRSRSSRPPRCRARGGGAEADPHAPAAARADRAAHGGGARLQRMRHLFLHRRGGGGALRGRGGRAAREPDLVRTDAHAARPPAGAPQGRGAQPGARLPGSRALRGRPRLPRRRARGAACAGDRPSCRPVRPADPTAGGVRSMSST
jgi:hypothetical protein